MDTVDEGLLRPGGLFFPGALADEFRHVLVGQQHKFFNQPVGFLAEFLEDFYRTARLVHPHFHFGAVEVDGAGRKAFPADDGGQLVEFQHGLSDGLWNAAKGRVPAVNDGLGAFVVETPVGIDEGADDARGDDFGFGGELEHHGEGEFVFVGTQGAELVGEFLRKHRDGPVHQIDGSPPFFGFLIHGGTHLDIVGDIRDMHADFVVPVFQYFERERVVEVLGI